MECGWHAGEEGEGTKMSLGEAETDPLQRAAPVEESPKTDFCMEVEAKKAEACGSVKSEEGKAIVAEKG